MQMKSLCEGSDGAALREPELVLWADRLVAQAPRLLALFNVVSHYPE